MPSLESQKYASKQSKEGHVNCKSGENLKKLLNKYFINNFVFSMNDEVVHTGFSDGSLFNRYWLWSESKIEMLIKNFIKKAHRLRVKTFNAFLKKEAHLGGSFSIIETLIILFDLIIDKKDKFILSKSHASFPLCIILREKGFKTKLTTHLEIDPKNGIYCTTGSLGHGLPIAAGMAFAKKVQKKKGKIYVLMSDGECQEGTTWKHY